jgi:KaiC/GvpD/RAD55 family RecA-like ATPase
MDTSTTSQELIQREVLGHAGLGLSEIRIIKKGVSEYATTDDEYQKSVLDYKDTDTYVGINPRSERRGTNDSIKYLTCLVIDIDPVREKDTPSTDEQHELALGVGRKIYDDFPGTYLVSSGSGCHVYFPIKPILVTNAKSLYKSVKKWGDATRAKYEVSGTKIDSIFDLARVIRVWGSHNFKSNRPCEFLEGPSTVNRFDFQFAQEVEEVLEDSIPLCEQRFLRLCVSNPVLSRITTGEAKFDSRSESDFVFISELTRAHFTPDEIYALRMKNPSGRKNDMKREDVDRVSQKARDNEMPTSSLIGKADEYIRSLKNRKMGLKTGFPTFDEMISGLKPQKVIVLAARPTEGKTTLATQVIRNIAEQGEMVLMFPTEVGSEPIYDKIVSAKTDIDLKQFQNGNFTDEQFSTIAKTREYLSKLPLAIVEDFSLSVDKIENHIAKIRPRVFVIDYIQALKFEEGSANEIGAAMRKIKELAGDYDCTAIVCSQLLREADGRDPFSLSRLKGSGAIEEFGDVIAFLHTPVEEKFIYPRPVSFVITKSKYSAIGAVPLKFWTSTCKLEEANEQA